MGDYFDLEDLYSMIWRLTETVEVESPESIILLNMAHEIRKGLENQREQVELGHGDLGKAMYKSVKLLWPDFLVALNLLRQRAGYTDTDRNLQANLYRLEHLALKILNETEFRPAQELANWITGYRLINEPLLIQKVTDINLRHLSEPNGKNRFRRLPEKMKILIPFSPESRIFEHKMKIQAKQMGCEPEELDIAGEEFDRLKWKW